MIGLMDDIRHKRIEEINKILSTGENCTAMDVLKLEKERDSLIRINESNRNMRNNLPISCR